MITDHRKTTFAYKIVNFCSKKSNDSFELLGYSNNYNKTFLFRRTCSHHE